MIRFHLFKINHCYLIIFCLFNKIHRSVFLLICILNCIHRLQVASSDVTGYIPWTFGKCLMPTVQNNFETKKFFQGKWYQQSSYGNYLFQLDGICPTVEYKITDDGEIMELDYHFEQMLMKYIRVSGNSYTQYIKDKQGYLPVTYHICGGLITYEVPVYIVGTDYDTWAVVYTCKQELLMKSEMSWIMTRARNSTDHQQVILDLLNKNGMRYEDYKPAVNIGCGPNEPHL